MFQSSQAPERRHCTIVQNPSGTVRIPENEVPRCGDKGHGNQDCPPEIPDWQERLAAGEPTAWAQVVAQYRALLLSVARRHRLSEGETADMMQETWMRLFTHAERLEHPERLAGWLKTTATREAIAVARRRWRERPSQILEFEACDESDFVERLEGRRLAGALRAAIAQLPDRQRLLLEAMLEPDPLSYCELSVRLGIPIGSIGPTRGRALARLQQLIDPPSCDSERVLTA